MAGWQWFLCGVAVTGLVAAVALYAWLYRLGKTMWR